MPTIHEGNAWPRYPIPRKEHPMSIDTKIDTKTKPRLPAELVASTLFLLKRLGFSAKQRSSAVVRSGSNSDLL